MKAVVIGIVVLVGVLGAGYFYLQSEIGLLGDETSLRIISEDVLGHSLHGQSCPPSSYASDVENLRSSRKAGAAAVFRFHPVAGKETECPPVNVIVDRKTGEAWVDKR